MRGLTAWHACLSFIGLVRQREGRLDRPATETPLALVQRNRLAGRDANERFLQVDVERVFAPERRKRERASQEREEGSEAHHLLTVHFASAPNGSERVWASASNPSGKSTLGGGWEGEIQRKSLERSETQRSMGWLREGKVSQGMELV